MQYDEKQKFARYNQSQLVKFRVLYGDGYPNGNDNLFPDYLDGLYNASPTHQGIINDYVNYIVGNGLKADNPQDQFKLDQFFKKAKVEKIVKTDLIQNTKSLEVLKDKLNNIVGINFILPKQLRVTSLYKNEPTAFKYRENWNRSSTYYNNQKDFSIYKQGALQECSLFYSYDSGTYFVPYGRPYYMSGLNAIEMEASIYLSHNHGLQNGMFPSVIIDRETAGSEGEDYTSTSEIVQSAAGPAAYGKIIDIKRPQGSAPLNITVPNISQLDKVNQENYLNAEAGIAKAHGLPSPTLIAGLNVKPTGFSDAAEEMEWAKRQLFKKKILPYRKDFINDLKPLFDELGIKGEVYFEDEEETTETLYSYDNKTLDTPSTNSTVTNLTGRQMQQIERTVRKFRKGTLSYEQASVLLKSGYGFNDDEVSMWLKSLEEFKSVIKKKDKLQELIDLGETEEDFEGWEIESIETAFGSAEEEDKFYKSNEKFVSTGTARPNSRSNQDGTKGNVQYKIRYRYAGNQVGQRDFCRRMLSANKLYRYEDIRNMSFSSVNPGFGRGGSNNYDIFSYKGGPNCKHKWERVTFVKQGLEGSVDTRSGSAKTLTESQADQRRMTPTGTARSKQRISETRPYDLPKRGYFSAVDWFSKTFFESYNDYPKAASDNARKALDWIEEHGRDEVDAGTRVGLERANQLANRENISEDTVKRMASFNRHRDNSKLNDEYRGKPWKDKGYVAWLLWGGDEGIDWALRKSENL